MLGNFRSSRESPPHLWRVVVRLHIFWNFRVLPELLQLQEYLELLQNGTTGARIIINALNPQASAENIDQCVENPIERKLKKELNPAIV